MNFSSGKNIKNIHFKRLPFFFERYEVFVVVFGASVAFMLAGYIFYEKAYKTVANVPKVDVEVVRVKAELFEETIKELKQRKEVSPDLPIIDPFR